MDVEKLMFQSYKNLSYALVKHHLNDFENLKYLILSSHNVSYVEKDLLTGLVNLKALNLRDNLLQLVAGFFSYTPRLQWSELDDDALQSIELGTFDNLKNLTHLNLWKNHLTELQSGIFDELNDRYYRGYIVISYLDIECRNSPKWTDFKVSLTKSEAINSVYLDGCDLPTNSSLIEIMRTLGVTNVDNLSIIWPNKNLNSTLGKYYLDDLKNLTHLHLSSRNMSYLDKEVLINLVNLKGFNLNNYNLPHLDAGFFNYTSKLKWLKLSNTALQSIDLGTFDNLKNLISLQLFNNHLTELQSGIFDELDALRSLEVEMNYMLKIPEDIFAKLENLEILNLSENNFTHFPKNMLRYNKKLNTFYLTENKRNMTTLPSEFFANLTELKALKLQKNGFIFLPEDLFWGCTSLSHIALERNYLRTLPVHIFRDLKNLTTLQLDSNALENLPDYIFANTNQLGELVLSKNRISFISNHLFEGLYALSYLDMEENHLSVIFDQGFSSLKQLRIAKLSYNNLTLPQYSIQHYVASPFHYCKLLRKLYLADNNIKEIFHDWNFGLPYLQILDLKHNDISRISNANMLFASKNVLVDLTYNNIKNILIDNTRFVYSIPHKTKILMDNNPLHCGCEVYNFLRYIEQKNPNDLYNFDIILKNLTCQSPNELKNVRVTDLKSKSFKCVTDTYSKTCEWIVKLEDSTFIFNCSHRNLTSAPRDKIIIHHSFPLELNFSGNRLTRMPDLKAMGLESVRKLILSHNMITDISLNGLSNTVQILELHNNNISRIHPDVIEFWKQSTNLTGLTLHGNPWKCDCYAKDFLNFIQKKLVTIPDLRKVTCLEGNISISEMILTDICSLDMITIVSFSIAIFLMGLFIGIFTLLYYKYQQQVKVCLFIHHCSWFIEPEEELDTEKLYDAFVSYSHKDEDFVVNELVTRLESGPKPFKLCLHYRDWIVGEWIPANIVHSVENSRRTIVVLSPNFLESVWGRMEFRTAHCQALSEGRARVILILYGDIGSTDNLDPELKAYISMNTYVKWGDPWFWDKLRYALPHKTREEQHRRRENL